MFFLNPWLLLGLLGVSVPLFLHLFNRRKSSLREWGAMMFLSASLAQRRKKIMVEEILLLAARCLIFAFAALAFARPYADAQSGIVWMAVAGAAVAAVVGFAVAAAAWSNKSLRKRVLIAAGALALFAAASAATDGVRSMIRAARAGARDVAIVLDASSSMAIRDAEGRSAFDRAKKEADDFIQSCPRNTAFTIVLGGSVPEALSASPVTDRKLLFRLLDEARPLEGTFRAPDAIALAASVLAQGANATKQFLVVGDGQSAGWQLGDAETWAYVQDVLSRLPGKPRIVWRTLGLPDRLRNLTVASLAFSRDVIGTDREVRIDATVANNGDEAATADSLLLSIEGRTYTDNSIGQLQPGQRRTVSFRHKFRKPGTHPAKAILEVADDLAADNSLTRIAAVRSEMKVLVVEGAKGRRLSDRPGAFIALSLSPTKSVVAPPAATTQKQPQGGAGEPARTHDFLVKPTLVNAADLGMVERFSDYAAVILADVPSIPTNSAARLLEYAELGGGLMVVNAARSRPAFYNAWADADGVPVMPLALGGDAPGQQGGTPIDPKTLSHPAVAFLAESGDLGTAVFEHCWKTSETTAPGVRIGARLVNGDALFADRKLGKGRVLQFAAALDPASGNLISRQSFLPMIHELAYFMARPIVPNLNLQPSGGATLALGGNALPEGESAAQGLRGVYRLGDKNGKLLKVEIDPRLEFNWNSKPVDAATDRAATIYAEWTGSLTVPVSRAYTIYAQGSGDVSITFPDDKKHFGLRRSNITVDLEAGRHDIVVTYTGRNGNNSWFNLRWRGPGLGDQIIPAEYLSPLRTTEKDWAETYQAEISSPRGALPATLRVRQDAVSLHFPHKLAPGVYTAAIPAAFAPQLGEIAVLSNGFARVDFCVATDSSESILTPATPDEVAFVARHADFVVAATPDELRRAINGATVGKELWRRAAIPLFALLLLEIFLTRWITEQRRLGEEGRVDFDEGNKPSSRFSEILKAMKGMR